MDILGPATLIGLDRPYRNRDRWRFSWIGAWISAMNIVFMESGREPLPPPIKDEPKCIENRRFS